MGNWGEIVEPEFEVTSFKQICLKSVAMFEGYSYMNIPGTELISPRAVRVKPLCFQSSVKGCSRAL